MGHRRLRRQLILGALPFRSLKPQFRWTGKASADVAIFLANEKFGNPRCLHGNLQALAQFERIRAGGSI